MTAGPYKIQEFKSGKSMTLVKNGNWDADTDPIRHQYVNQFNVVFNKQYEDSTKSILDDSGENATSISFNNQVDAGNLSKVLADAQLKSRTVSGYMPYVGQVNINLSQPEMKDKKVREAIAHALPITPFVRAYGGAQAMEVAGGLISPTVSGYNPDFDPFGKKKKPAGDPEKGKELLTEAGKEGMKLTFGYINTPEGQQYSTAMAAGLEKAGFDVQRQEIPAETFYDQVSKVDNNFDIYHTAWGCRLAERLDRDPAAVRRPPDPGRCLELLAHQRPEGQRGHRPGQRDHRPGQGRGGVEQDQRVRRQGCRLQHPDRVLQADPDRRFADRRPRVRRHHRWCRPAQAVREVTLHPNGAPGAPPPAGRPRPPRLPTPESCYSHAALPPPPVPRRRRDPGSADRGRVPALLRHAT
ncbi:hypothetical protein GCM10020295_28180 [Streptomyces cinereospinus]